MSSLFALKLSAALRDAKVRAELRGLVCAVASFDPKKGIVRTMLNPENTHIIRKKYHRVNENVQLLI
jgi:hypothetical protein